MSLIYTNYILNYSKQGSGNEFNLHLSGLAEYILLNRWVHLVAFNNYWKTIIYLYSTAAWITETYK